MNNAAFLALLSPPGLSRSERLDSFIVSLRDAQDLELLVDTPVLLMLGAPGAAHLTLPEGQGVIWGHLFDRETNARLAHAERPTDGAAEEFLSRFWGGYVAIRVLDGGVEILRDPSGAVACYQAAIDGAQIITSRPDLLFEYGLLVPEIDWTIIAQSLVFRDLRPAQTALRGISELLPGVAARLTGEGLSTRCAWSPWCFAGAARQIDEREAAIALLRDTASDVLRAWRRCFARPLLEISGGLDSAIVAAGGHEAGSQAACVTFGPAPGDPDELPYARAVAEHLGLALHPLSLAVDAVDLARSDAAHLPRPCARNFSQALDRPIQSLAAELGADGFIGGAGGDNVFCLLQSALPVVDRYLQQGIGRGLLRTADEIARLSRTNVWQVLLVAARRWRRPDTRLPTPRSNRFIAAQVRENLPWPSGNPWLEAPADIPPGKRRHVWSLIGIQNHLEGYGREALAPHVSPLMSQPLLEACLRIPSWLWCSGGNNRAIAREAFRNRLPAAVIDRRTKGSFDGFAQRLIHANRPLLRDMLLDGILSHKGLLDHAAVRAALDGGALDSEALPQLLALADIEAWAMSWERRSGGPRG